MTARPARDPAAKVLPLGEVRAELSHETAEKVRRQIEATMDAEAPVVITSEDRAALAALAAELDNPDLPPDRRLQLMEGGSLIAEKYACDPRLCE